MLVLRHVKPNAPLIKMNRRKKNLLCYYSFLILYLICSVISLHFFNLKIDLSHIRSSYLREKIEFNRLKENVIILKEYYNDDLTSSIITDSDTDSDLTEKLNEITESISANYLTTVGVMIFFVICQFICVGFGLRILLTPKKTETNPSLEK